MPPFGTAAAVETSTEHSAPSARSTPTRSARVFPTYRAGCRATTCRGCCRGAAPVSRAREAGLGATAHVGSSRPTWEGWEDSAVPPEQLGDYLRDLRALLDRYDYIG